MPPTTINDNALWEPIFASLRTLLSADVFSMWFADIRCLEADADRILLEVPSDFNAIWIENNYLDILSQQIAEHTGRNTAIELRVAESNRLNQNTAPKVASESPRNNRSRTSSRSHEPAVALPRPAISPRNTFSSFIVGGNNQLAHAASIAVANEPGRAYNPLFVFGETGLGKTHLMHAVAHQMLQNKPDAKIAYVSTEKFTNEFIHAIRENKLVRFRQFYRNVDALLVDDIHFLSGKESTQEEFFHTFNELFESGKQIFLASDRPANEIERLENRLISRFQWGLVTDIQAPDFETRAAILRKKADSLGISLEPEILHFLAERIARNVRMMEGALTRIGSYASLINRPVDISTVEGLLADLLHKETLRQVTIEVIQKKVADYFQIRVAEMVGRRRSSGIVFPRQVAMYISRTLTSLPLKDIGDSFGGRDHGTVIHACKQVENMMEQDPSTQRSVDYLTRQLRQTN
jgi:chromosomal replication initiator protein